MIATGSASVRAFFREEFRRRTIVIALSDATLRTVVPVIRELLDGESRVIVVTGGADHTETGTARGCGDLAGAFGAGVVSMPTSVTELATLWTDVADSGIGVITAAGAPTRAAAELAGRLGVFKLVVTDPVGGCGKSFAGIEDIAEFSPDRPLVADAVRVALAAGVSGVNVCRADDLDTELFTFDGAGTLFSADAYVQVTRLGADDLAMVEQLVARGVTEGFLRPRSRAEVIRLALGGLGARVGPDRNLVGFGALETERYESAGVAEVACLYTVNRYAGEGIGGRLVTGLTDAARLAGVKAVFACTVSDRAAALFERCGFRTVSQDRLPGAKWVDYDADRRGDVTAHWLDLDVDNREGVRP